MVEHLLDRLLEPAFRIDEELGRRHDPLARADAARSLHVAVLSLHAEGHLARFEPAAVEGHEDHVALAAVDDRAARDHEHGPHAAGGQADIGVHLGFQFEIPVGKDQPDLDVPRRAVQVGVDVIDRAAVDLPRVVGQFHFGRQPRTQPRGVRVVHVGEGPDGGQVGHAVHVHAGRDPHAQFGHPLHDDAFRRRMDGHRPGDRTPFFKFPDLRRGHVPVEQTALRCVQQRTCAARDVLKRAVFQVFNVLECQQVFFLRRDEFRRVDVQHRITLGDLLAGLVHVQFLDPPGVLYVDPGEHLLVVVQVADRTYGPGQRPFLDGRGLDADVLYGDRVDHDGGGACGSHRCGGGLPGRLFPCRIVVHVAFVTRGLFPGRIVVHVAFVTRGL